jgi:hypothetical protein
MLGIESVLHICSLAAIPCEYYQILNQQSIYVQSNHV